MLDFLKHTHGLFAKYVNFFGLALKETPQRVWWELDSMGSTSKSTTTEPTAKKQNKKNPQYEKGSTYDKSTGKNTKAMKGGLLEF